MKRIFAIVLLIFMTIPVIVTCASLRNQSKMIASHREWDKGDMKIILQESVPLGTTAERSYCLETLNLINAYRIANGRQTLLWSEDLAAAAEIRAEESTVRWSHTRPNGTQYYTVNQKIVYGENLGRGYATPKELVDAWIASPAHNDNLLFAQFKYAGLAYINGHCALEFCY